MSLYTSVLRVKLVPLNMFKPSSILTDCSKAVLLLWIHFVIGVCLCLCNTVPSVPCSLVITCWERADLLVLLCVMVPCVFVTFPYGVLGKVWYLIVSIPDLCILPNFSSTKVILLTRHD